MAKRRTGIALKRDTIEKLIAAALIAVIFTALQAAGITCPIKFITGVSCAGCGMTRAWLCVLRLDFSGAFYYHPLFWTLPAAVIVFLKRDKLGMTFIRVFIAGMAAAFMAVYIYRLMLGDGDIVVFEPQNNIIFRILRSTGG